MINVLFQINKTGFTFLKAQGHALFAQKGEDVVCAAVSALIETLAFGLRYTLKLEIPSQLEYSKAEGSLMMTIHQDQISLEQRHILNHYYHTFYYALKQIEKQHTPFLKIIQEET